MLAWMLAAINVKILGIQGAHVCQTVRLFSTGLTLLQRLLRLLLDRSAHIKHAGKQLLGRGSIQQNSSSTGSTEIIPFIEWASGLALQCEPLSFQCTKCRTECNTHTQDTSQM